MELKILKGTSLLTNRALLHNGEIFLPASVLEQVISRWDGLVFFMNPLQGKKVCLTVLGPPVRDALPPWIQHLAELCQTAGATILWHDGGPLPHCDLFLVLESGVSQIRVNHLGPAFRGAPLARQVAQTLKRGLRLTYLPDPLPYRKPEHNLRLSLRHWLFTPGVVVSWPENQPDIAGWLFTALLAFWGQDSPPQDNLFPLTSSPSLPSTEIGCRPKERPGQNLAPDSALPGIQGGDLPQQSNPLHTQHPAPETLPRGHQSPFGTAQLEDDGKPDKPRKPRYGKPVNPAMISVMEARKNPSPPGPAEPGNWAGMSRAQYPEFFKLLEESKTKRESKKEPFS